MKKKSPLMYFKMVQFPYPCRKHEGIFLQYLLWNLEELPVANLTLLWESSYDCVPLEILTLIVVHTEPPAIQQL